MRQDLEGDFATCTGISTTKTLLASNKDRKKPAQSSGSISFLS